MQHLVANFVIAYDDGIIGSHSPVNETAIDEIDGTKRFRNNLGNQLDRVFQSFN